MVVPLPRRVWPKAVWSLKDSVPIGQDFHFGSQLITCLAPIGWPESTPPFGSARLCSAWLGSLSRGRVFESKRSKYIY